MTVKLTMRASGVSLKRFSASADTIRAPDAPWQSWLALAADIYAAFLQRLHRANGVKRSIPADSFVDLMETTVDREWHDLTSEVPAGTSRCGLAMAIERKAVESLAIEAVFSRYHLGAIELTECVDSIAGFDPVAKWTRSNTLLGMK